MLQQLPPAILMILVIVPAFGLLLWLVGRVGFCVGVEHCMKQRPALCVEARMGLAARWGVPGDDIEVFVKEWVALEALFDNTIYLDDRVSLLIAQPIRYVRNPVKNDLVDLLCGRMVTRDVLRRLESMCVGEVLDAMVVARAGRVSRCGDAANDQGDGPMADPYREIVGMLRDLVDIVDKGKYAFDVNELVCMIFDDCRAIEESRERRDRAAPGGPDWAAMHDVLVRLRTLLDRMPETMSCHDLRRLPEWPAVARDITRLP